MLEWQIDHATVEAFAILGMQTGFLYSIDRDWLRANVDRIFQIEPYSSERSDQCGWAAWNAFLVWVAPHVEYYRMLSSQYAYSVHQSADVEVTERRWNSRPIGWANTL